MHDGTCRYVYYIINMGNFSNNFLYAAEIILCYNVTCYEFTGGTTLKLLKRRAALCALTTLFALSLTGCTGTQSAARDNAINVVRADASAEYNLATVRRGDISLTESVRVTYFAARAASYGFATSGIYYENFQVSVGDQVQAGDVLATLESAEIDAEIASCEAEIDSLTLERDRNSALLALYDARLAGREAATGTAGRTDARRRTYEVAIRDAEDRMEVLDVRLDELNAQRAGRVVTADIDGTVTYVRDVQPGETSVKGRTIITVTDLSSCAFESTVEHPEAIPFDQTYDIRIDGQDYAIYRTTAEELGVAEEPMNEKSARTRVYFAPLVPSVNLAEGASGKFTVVVQKSEDTLYVPATCVAEADGQTCVYILDDAGLKTIRPITVGLLTPRSCEITSGLDEGDRVVN